MSKPKEGKMSKVREKCKHKVEDCLDDPCTQCGFMEDTCEKCGKYVSGDYGDKYLEAE